MNMHELENVTRWGRVPAWWLMHPEIDADRFCVMAAMATYADREGYCDPSQATLARHLRRSRPWVNRVVAELASAGLLRKTARVRANGGTTSCRYRLAMVPSDVVPSGATAPVTAVAEPRPACDSPRHRPDTNQPVVEQSHGARPDARAGADLHSAIADAGFATGRAEARPTCEVPRGWAPSDEAVAEALRLCPDADLEEHTARFVSRCRAKGYKFARHGIDDAWLAWLLEDRQRARERAQERAALRPLPGAGATAHAARSSGLGHRHDRFAAWGVAADRLSDA